jgi:hypothetical protein
MSASFVGRVMRVLEKRDNSDAKSSRGYLRGRTDDLDLEATSAFRTASRRNVIWLTFPMRGEPAQATPRDRGADGDQSATGAESRAAEMFAHDDAAALQDSTDDQDS